MLSFFKKEATTPVVSNIDDLLRVGNDLLSDDTIVLNDQLTANLFCTGEVSVESYGALSGNIISEVCTISGKVRGDIAITERLEIKSTAIINGDIKAPVINIEEGAIINGRIAVKNEITAVKVDLLNRLKRYSAADFSAAKTKAVINDADIAVKDAEPHKQEAKQSFGTLRAAEKREPVAEKPKIVQKELSAATPQPKATEISEANNRWW